MSLTMIVVCMIVCATVSALYLGLYLYLRHRYHKEPHHDPIEAIDQPSTRGNLFRGRLGIDDYHRYLEEKRRRRDLKKNSE